MKYVALVLKIILMLPLFTLMAYTCFLYLTNYLPQHNILDNLAQGLLLILLIAASLDLFKKTK
ncbi:hypothetical protein AB1283_26170 [Bacillus sp. S13(2024)]|uniref:hypothetical protein n=1 Tax=Bacillus sp. S13(2024) TaxID=3162885 RepID=UPI003D1AE721